MEGLELANPAWTLSLHERSSMKAHKPLPKRRDYIDSLAFVTSLPLSQKDYPKSVEVSKTMDEELPLSPRASSSPAPPLTPPSIVAEPLLQDYDADVENVGPKRKSSRAGTVTPPLQKKPPTPDSTPPRVETVPRRPFLGTQPSISSRAESFKTAREEISSDDGSEGGWNMPHRPTPWASALLTSASADRLSDTGEIPRKSNLRHEISNDSTVLTNGSRTTPTQEHDLFKQPSTGSSTIGELIRDRNVHQELTANGSLPSPPTSEPSEASPVKTTSDSYRLQRRVVSDDPKPRTNGRLQHHTGEFERAINKVPSDDADSLNNRVNSWRLSGISTTSTVEAIVVDTVLPKHQKLRHTRKNASLRSASSPIPQSNRTSWNSGGSNEMHRLVRKPARLTNENRWSMNSDISKTLSNTSSLPSGVVKQQVEIIPVVVIPQRKSSLKSSSNSSRRQSDSTSPNSGPHPTVNSGNSSIHQSHEATRSRSMSDSRHDKQKLPIRGRDRHYPPVVPARTSSLSAPTSQNGSRTSSLTSEGLRLKRMAAEDDVHHTLAQMESRLSKLPTASQSSPRQVSVERTESAEEKPREPRPTTPSSEVSAGSGHLRPPSVPFTPFSGHTVLTSSSPGTVEIHEATAINYFAHNNHSLQLINPHMIPQSDAVRQLQADRNDVSTPDRQMIPDIVMDSPLKNPRNPPQPPAFKVIPPTPSVVTPSDELDRQLGQPVGARGTIARGLGSVKRAFSTRQSYPSRLTYIQSMSTTKARNRILEQNLDRNLHPLWRPRSFWDDHSETNSDEDDDDLVVNNSLGMPQQRVVFDGPLALVRRISDRRRRQRDRDRVVKRASRTSLGRGGFHSRSVAEALSSLGLRLQVLRLRNFQDRLIRARARRDEQRREKRRIELRKSIGHNIRPQGDSRFPMSPPATRNGTLEAGLPITQNHYD